MLDPNHTVFKRSLDKWGFASQAGMINEEVGELIEVLGRLIKKLNQFDRRRIDLRDLMEEGADVSIMMMQLRQLDPVTFDEIVDFKINRLEGRIDKVH